MNFYDHRIGQTALGTPIYRVGCRIELVDLFDLAHDLLRHRIANSEGDDRLSIESSRIVDAVMGHNLFMLLQERAFVYFRQHAGSLMLKVAESPFSPIPVILRSPNTGVGIGLLQAPGLLPPGEEHTIAMLDMLDFGGTNEKPFIFTPERHAILRDCE